MTNQEIIEQLESLKSHCEDFREDEDCVWSKDVEALDRAIEAVEKVEKYKWHDLKKNPDDLPVLKIGNEYVEVLIEDVAEPFALQYDDAIMKFGEWHDIYDPDTLGYLDSEFKEWDTSTYKEIIAWRYIEEFEGQEE